MEKQETIDKTEAKQRSLANLKPFKKGQSGNPNGRPKGSGVSITTEIKRKLSEVSEVDDEKKKTYLELLINKIIDKTIKEGDSKMLDRMWAYVDGMPKQSVELGMDETIDSIKININRNGTKD